MLSDGKGIPLNVLVTGANVHDIHLLEEMLDTVWICKPATIECQSHLCLDAGYIGPDSEVVVSAHNIHPHIRPRKQEAVEKQEGKKARRWVVERTHSWMNRFRRLLVRWEKLEITYLGFIQLACAVIVLSRLIPG